MGVNTRFKETENLLGPGIVIPNETPGLPNKHNVPMNHLRPNELAKF